MMFPAEIFVLIANADPTGIVARALSQTCRSAASLIRPAFRSNLLFYIGGNACTLILHGGDTVCNHAAQIATAWPRLLFEVRFVIPSSLVLSADVLYTPHREVTIDPSVSVYPQHEHNIRSTRNAWPFTILTRDVAMALFHRLRTAFHPRIVALSARDVRILTPSWDRWFFWDRDDDGIGSIRCVIWSTGAEFCSRVAADALMQEYTGNPRARCTGLVRRTKSNVDKRRQAFLDRLIPALQQGTQHQCRPF